jgi:NADH-quinone oxidoreductase subunit H
VKRFVAMIAVLVGLFVGLVVLGAVGYLAAGWFGAWVNGGVNAVTGQIGWRAAPVYVGASIANTLILMLGLLMTAAALLTVAERKWSAMMQNRIGANRIRVFGKHPLGGIPFLLADALKMLTKERVEPRGRTRFLYELAPVLSFAPVFALFAVVPVGMPVDLSSIPGLSDAPGELGKIALQVASPDVGLLYLFAIASLAVYGTSLAGWASNNKLALLGGVRAASQMISYEVSLGLSLVGCMLAYRTLRLDEMVAAQGNLVIGPVPALGILLQPVGFLVFFASAFAETKRAPFDLPEGESEIVGYFVEYSGMQFGLMFLAEFAEIVVLSGVVAAVFLGGWHPILFEGWLGQTLSPFWFAALGAGVFLAKTIVVMWLQLTIRWLLPRFRYDQIQKLCWKILLPTALANVFVTAAVALVDPSLTLLAWVGIFTLVIIGILTAAAGRAPAPAPAQAQAGGSSAHAAAGGH